MTLLETRQSTRPLLHSGLDHQREWESLRPNTIIMRMIDSLTIPLKPTRTELRGYWPPRSVLSQGCPPPRPRRHQDPSIILEIGQIRRKLQSTLWEFAEIKAIKMCSRTKRPLLETLDLPDTPLRLARTLPPRKLFPSGLCPRQLEERFERSMRAIRLMIRDLVSRTRRQVRTGLDRAAILEVLEELLFPKWVPSKTAILEQ